MKTKAVGFAVLLFALGSICAIGVHAQRSANNSSSPLVTTNWVGFLVTGRNDTIDRITPNPSPAVLRQVEIGLRSDGVVIWRNAPGKK